VFEGLHHTSYVTEYTENPDCLSHYVLDRIVRLPQSSRDLTLGQLLERGREDLNAEEAVLEFSRDIIQKLVCPHCGDEEEQYLPVGAVRYDRGFCPRDGRMRVVRTLSGFRGETELAARTLDRLGLPLFDVFTVRAVGAQDAEISYCIAGDAEAVLGPLAHPKEVAP
jgi:hypothetical protein